jgi:hypothetical protein
MRGVEILFALAVAAAPAVALGDEPASDTPAPPPASETPPPSPPPAASDTTTTPPPNDAPAAAPPSTDPAEEHAPAALQGEPPPPPSSTPTKPAATVTEKPPEHRVGDPIALTRRMPTVDKYGFMVGVRYGLVGTGPTRFVDDIRFGLTENIELRTDLVPYPSSLMLRWRFGSPQDPIGAPIVDVGLAHWDAGIRIVPDTGESAVGMRFHFEGGLSYAKTLGDKTMITALAHYRYRLSLLPNDDQHAIAVDGHISYDLLDSLNVAAGLGFATTIGTPVRELSILFVETDAPGVSHLLARDEGARYEVTVPLSMTYGRVENFDVDLFCTPRVWPTLGILFGAGVRLRFDPFTS